MTVQLEDLYLKGLKAYNAQDLKSAQAYWEQVTTHDPAHPKANQGLEKIRQILDAKPKRSSKDVFQDIKKLYAEKKFAEALRLTQLLLKKHPDNQDLQSLQVKLEARVKPAGKSPVPAVDPKRSTMVIANAAELSVSAGDEAIAAQVERFIQEGVSLYEIQDYEQAIAVWKKALSLDPNNRIARDYVQNVSALVESEARAAEESAAPAPAPAPSPAADSGKPSREKMLEVYNQAMTLFKERRYQEALDTWNYILGFYPTHAETLQCIEKTKALMQKEQAFADQLETARAHIANAAFSEAESLLTRLSIEAPHLAGIEQARQELSSARANRGPESKPNLDLLYPTEPTTPPASSSRPAPSIEPDKADFSATDEQITSFFEPTAKAQAGPRKVVAATPVKKKKSAPVNVFKWIAIVVGLGVLAIGGYFTYDYIKKRPTIRTVEPVLVADVPWNSEQRVVEDFFNFGNDFADESEFLLSLFAFQRVETIGTLRVRVLQEQTEPQPEWEQELTNISERINKSKARIREVQRKIRGDRVDPGAVDLARTEIRREEYNEAADRLKAVLMSDPTNERARDLLGQAHERIAFKKLAEGDLSGASNHFKCAAVLSSDFDMPRRHMEVIQRYFEGDIRKEDKDQWFYFYN